MQGSAFVLALGLFALACARAPEELATSSSPAPDLACGECSVLFLNVELLRADHVGLLNPKSDCTPNIDRFFARSIVFEDASAPAGETARSSAAVLSAVEGLFFENTWRIRKGLRAQKAEHAGKLTTIAELLSAAGFATFNVNEGRRSGKHIGYDVGFQQYFEREEKDLIEDSVAFLLEQLAPLAQRRFFGLYHPYTLHAPDYAYPAGRERLAHTSVKYMSDGERLLVRTRSDALDEGERRDLARALYRQQVRYVDDGLRALFDVLEEHFADDTIIVLFANHGEGLFDNGVEAHGVSYQSCVHVPLLIRHPRLDAQVRIAHPVSLVDLVPTILELVGVAGAPHMSGVSLMPLVRGGDYARTHVFGKNLQSRYVRRGDWKLIADPEELYNLRDDPHEERNLLREHPAVADELLAALLAEEKALAELREQSAGGGR